MLEAVAGTSLGFEAAIKSDFTNRLISTDNSSLMLYDV